MRNVTVAFDDGIIGAQEIMSAFGVLNGNEITFDAEYTLPVLVRALIESKRELEVLNVCPEERPEFAYLDLSRMHLCRELETTFKYVAEPPQKVTLRALSEAFLGHDPDHRLEVINLARHLRELTLSQLDFDTTELYLLGGVLQPLTSQAWQLETLIIHPRGNDMPTVHDPLLHFTSLFRGSQSFRHLQLLELRLVESPASLLSDVLSKNSHSLTIVFLHHVRITRGGSWFKVLQNLRSVSFKTLCRFILLDCEGVKKVVAAEDYINRITSKNPIDDLD